MPRQQVIYDLMDLIIRFEDKISQDDFAVYIYSLYAHNRQFRYVRIFEGIFDKDVLQNFLDERSLDIRDYHRVRAGIDWEFSLWTSGIRVRKNKARDFPRIQQIILEHLDELYIRGKEIFNATLNYLGTLDIDEFVARASKVEDDDDDDASKTSKSSVASSISSTTGTRRPRSVTLDEVRTICKNHIPDASERNKRIKARDEHIQRRLQEEDTKRAKRAQREAAKIEKEQKKAQKEAERETKKIQKALRAAEEAEDRELRRQIREAEKEKLAYLKSEREARKLEKEANDALKLKLKQDFGVVCECGVYYTPSNFSHHQKNSIIHKQFVEKFTLAQNITV